MPLRRFVTNERPAGDLPAGDLPAGRGGQLICRVTGDVGSVSRAQPAVSVRAAAGLPRGPHGGMPCCVACDTLLTLWTSTDDREVAAARSSLFGGRVRFPRRVGRVVGTGRSSRGSLFERQSRHVPAGGFSSVPAPAGCFGSEDVSLVAA